MEKGVLWVLKRLAAEQEALARKVSLKDAFNPSKLRLVGGVDQAFLNGKIISSAVTCNPDMELVERRFHVEEECFPYMPGFLSYREAPCAVKAFEKLKEKPELLFVDGNGVLHPRRIGFASHVGLLLDTPTIGVAKKLLLGAVGIFKDGVAEVTLNGELLGFAVYTKEHAKPVYVSPGHKVSFETALECFKKALKGHKLPEPLHLAHKNANKVKKRLNLDG